MNKSFPRILSLLRKEHDLSQKQVAADLDISQALLSHYEKGIRECGLDFVVKVSKYYGVTCDFLLGCSPHPNNFSLADPASEFPPDKQPSAELARFRQILFDTINILFALLEKINSPQLSEEISEQLSCTAYSIYRLLYTANGKNSPRVFRIDSKSAERQVLLHMLNAENHAKRILDGTSTATEPIPKDNLPLLTNEILKIEFPSAVRSLLELIDFTERAILQQEKNRR